jgi:hypothetical protein
MANPGFFRVLLPPETLPTSVACRISGEIQLRRGQPAAKKLASWSLNPTGKVEPLPAPLLVDITSAGPREGDRGVQRDSRETKANPGFSRLADA